MKSWKMTACSTALGVLGLAMAPVLAQQPSESAPPPPQAPQTQQAPTAQYSDDQLKKFIGASEKVAAVAEKYNPKLQATQDESDRQEIYQEADKKMVSAVQDEGMSVNEFNDMSRAVQQDPSLRERVQNMLE